MSSNWNRSIGRAFALRLGLWYAGLFIASAIALSGATYVLLARALAAQDHDALASMLSRYALEYQREGLIGLQNVITADAGQGRHERLLVRVVNRRTDVVYFAAPPGWGGFDLSPLDQPAVRSSGWATIASPPDDAVLEVGTVTLSDGVIVQVGRSSHVRDELLANFRARGLAGAGIDRAGGCGRRVSPDTCGPCTPARVWRRRCDRFFRPGSSMRACPSGTHAIPSTSWERASTKCWDGFSRSFSACAARSTTSPTTCGRL